MTDEPSSITRRKLLGTVGGFGAVGALTGTGTWAMLTDEESFPATLSAGAVGISLDCDGCTSGDDGTLSFGFDGLEPGDDGVERFTLTVEANPVRIWLRTDCPPAVEPLGDGLEVRLVYDETCGPPDTTTGTPVYPADGGWTTLSEFRTGLRNGIRLDELDGGPCLATGTELCLDLEYRLPAGATWTQDLDTDLVLDVAAEQCRHVSEETVESPFPAVDCPVVECPDCVELGKLEPEGDRLAPGTYAFDELFSPFADDGTTYAIEVLTATDKAEDGGRETVCAGVRLLAGEDGPLDESNAPPICSVAVAGGPSGGGGPPGDGGGPPEDGGGPPEDSGGGPNVVAYDVDPPTTRTRGQVCTELMEGPGNAPPRRPAISHLVVSVCADGGDGDDPDGECTACPPGEGEGERIDAATFEYAGPDGVTVTFDQQGTGESSGETVEVLDVTGGDAFTVDLHGSGSPDFDVSVDSTSLSVPAQSDPTALHTSCSQVFGPGLELVDADGTYTLTVVSAVDKAGNDLCEVTTR